MVATNSDRLTLVTGASSGIGEALAYAFARHGHPLVLTGRSESRLNAVADAVAETTGERPVVIAADLAQPGAGMALAQMLASKNLRPAFVVNSAGNGLFGTAERLGVNEQLALIQLNCTTLTEITLALLPDALAQRGGVLNVGSVGGFFPGPGMAVYFATKAYVQSFSQGLRAEYNDGRLRVSALCPGPVATRFQSRARMIAPKTSRLLQCDLDRIAEDGYRGLMQNRAVVAPGFFNAAIVALAGAIFHRACIPFVRRFHFGKSRERESVSRTNATPNAVALAEIADRSGERRGR